MEKINIQKMQKARPAAGLQDLLPAVVAFVLIAIVGAVGALILQNFQSNNSVNAYCANTLTGTLINYGTTCTGGLGGSSNFIVYPVPYNAVGFGISGVNTVMTYLPLIALVIVAAILIGIVLVAFSFEGSKGEKF